MNSQLVLYEIGSLKLIHIFFKFYIARCVFKNDGMYKVPTYLNKCKFRFFKFKPNSYFLRFD